MCSELKMSDQDYITNAIKDLVQLNKNLERKYDQYCENIEATQRIIVEKVGGIRSLIELNYKEIINNRHEILENRKLILNRIDLLDEKIDNILKQLNP